MKRGLYIVAFIIMFICVNAFAVDKSDNCNIKKLEITNYDIIFDNNIANYNLKINNENTLNFVVEMEEEKASYNIVGNNNLDNGSIIKIITKSESGLEKEYLFNITKENVSNTQNVKRETNITLYIIAAVLLLMGVILIYISSKIKKKKVLKPDDLI